MHFIKRALELLKVARIDYGIRALEDDKLMEQIIQKQIPLTVCPLSNLKLCVVKDLREHNLKVMLDRGVCVTINSDDPAYFGGYMNQNFMETTDALQLDKEDLIKLTINSFAASFLSEQEKRYWIEQCQKV